MFDGNVGDKIAGKPYGLGRDSSTGESSGGRPCGVAFEGSDVSFVVFDPVSPAF